MSAKKDTSVSIENSQEKFGAASQAANGNAVGASRGSKLANLFLRMSGMGIPLFVLTLMVTAKQTTTILTLQISADFKVSKAFEAVVGASAVVAAYSFIQTIIDLMSFFNHNTVATKKAHAWIVFLADQSLTYLLFGATAAATEVAYISKNGSKRVGWSAVCDNFNKFCNIVGGAIVLCYLAVVVLMVTSVLSARRLFTR
ncbi:hypothetical protein O6H91_04G026100 [Diphasiastrum complanatum]|uniref:Uncharacterized protein n=1 Tax=Diphasiastrum complanatum TaxID=34168 RepID=A0ACC2DVB5_DIPCM|nr:hypothetical protein O6H91_04G026100 [Diphasiastrum complanatum]